MTDFQITYTKLRSGDWGVRIAGPLSSRGIERGDNFSVDVKKRDGSTKQEDIRVMWIGADKFGGGECALCSIDRPLRRGGGMSERATAGHWICRGCGEETAYSEGNSCWECGMRR